MKLSSAVKTTSLILGIAFSVFAVSLVVFAWTAPAFVPPTCPDTNPACLPPIHVGGDQVKTGALGIGGVFRTNLAVHLAVDSGNVGIGTTSPGARLHVWDGDIILGRPQALYPGSHRQFILHGAWNNLYIAPRNDANTDWLWDRLVITSGGNVGIGTTSPGARLDVLTTAINEIGISSVDNGGARIFTVPELGGGGYNPMSQAGDIGLIYHGTAHNTGGLVIGQWSSLARGIRIDPTGNVGIGTASPTTRLDIEGQIRIRGGNPAAGRVLTSDATGLATWGTIASLPTGTSGQTLRHDGANWVANSVLFNNGTNIGIGTTSPVGRLHVAGDIVQDNSNRLLARNSAGTAEPWMWPRYSDNVMYTNFGAGGWNIRNNASTPVMFMTNTGNVGIGTASPGARLDVGIGSSQCCAPQVPNISLAQASNTNNQMSWLQFHNAGESEAYIRLAGGGTGVRAGQRRLEVGDSQGVNTSLTVTGNVGIGTTAPGSTAGVARVLEVASGAHAGIVLTDNDAGGGRVELWNDQRNLRLWDPTIGDRMFWGNTGNVGIGTASPTAPLTVVGNILATTNTHDHCAWQSWTCADQQSCPSGSFMTAVERGANSGAALCNVSPRQWYQMRIHCCQI